MLAKDRTIPRSEKEDYYVQHIRQHTLCVQVICAPTSLGELMCSGPGKHYTSRGVPSQRRDPELRNPQSIIRELQPLPNIISIVLRNELQRDILLHSSKVVLLQTSLKRLSGGVWVRGVMLAWQAEMWEIHGGQFPNKQFLSILFFLSLLNLPCNFFFFFSWPHCMASWPGIHPVPLGWKYRVLTAGPPGKSLNPSFLCFLLSPLYLLLRYDLIHQKYFLVIGIFSDKIQQK